ncbi:hypothetical protein MMC22_006778 [Lobaria immixta]|nr:hypothetical protein [Lobaria immixta]
MTGIITVFPLPSGLTLLVLFLSVWYYLIWSTSKQTRFKDRTRCESILRCRKSDATRNLSIQDSVEARALPNQRLIQVFGIDNAFTTFDNTYRKQFREQAEGKLILTDEKWKGLADFAHTLVSKSLQPEANRDGIPLVPLVQSLALKISMHVLFELDPLTLNNITISNLAHQINELWLESKSSPPNNTKIIVLKEELEENLGKIFPKKSSESTETPMNLILPAYETMWRIVFRCFLEVAFRNPAAAPTWRRALARYLETPTAEQFESASDEEPVSVSFIVAEALRLYPPTKRVFRKFPEQLGRGVKTIAADIEACQRDADVWGPQSLEFVPSRWRDLSPDVQSSFMPFGGPPFFCPAKKEFGPRMIGLLVAALAQRVSKYDGWTLNNEENWDGQGPLPPLDPSRKAYHSLSISRRSSLRK